MANLSIKITIFLLLPTDESERMGSVSLLARMFSEKGSNLAKNHRPLWLAFLGRYNDISVAIRTKCVQVSIIETDKKTETGPKVNS